MHEVSKIFFPRLYFWPVACEKPIFFMFFWAWASLNRINAVCWIHSVSNVIPLEQTEINPSTLLGCLCFATKNRYGGSIFHSPLTSLRISFCVRIKVFAGSQLENNQPPVVLLHRVAKENVLQKSHLAPELVICAEALFTSSYHFFYYLLKMFWCCCFKTAFNPFVFLSCFLFLSLSLLRIFSPLWFRFSAPTSWSALWFCMRFASLFGTATTTHRTFSSQDTTSLSAR